MTTAAAAPMSGANALLDYYKQHNLIPVHYEMANEDWHFQRRASLYRSLGIHPVTIRNARVMETAVGTGQNSLYPASLRPRSYTLVEPNPAAIREIKALYCRPEYTAWRPELFEGTLQDFNPAEPFDVVVCENWLGQTPGERSMIRKLGTLVAPGGLLSITTVSPVGFLPNALRRLLAVRLGCWQHDFDDAAKLLVGVFAPHLKTMPAMTRSALDWVHDTMLNPHYLHICLSIPMVADDLGATMTFVGSSPDFAVDWRWFKSLCGDARQFNAHFVNEYYANCHNFLDHRCMLPRADAARTQAIEQAALQLVGTARQYDAMAQRSPSAGAEIHERILAELDAFLAAIDLCDAESIAALREFADVYAIPKLTPEDVRDMQRFAGLFGRETVYVSLEKNAA